MIDQLDVGSWGLLCGLGGKQIVLVDDQPCGPASSRRLMRATPRRLLLDEGRVRQVYQDGRARSEIVEHAGARWRVELKPITSPHSSMMVGLLCGVFPAEGELPDPVPVGSWEWVIPRDEKGDLTTDRITYWDRNLFRIYDVEPDVEQRETSFWKVGDWVAELIDPVDRMRMMTIIRDGIQDGLEGAVDRVRCLTYHVLTGYGSETRGRRHLRLVGVVRPVRPDDDRIVLQGFSYVVPEDFHDIAFEQDANAGRVDDVLRGVMALAQVPIAVVDALNLDVLLASKAWQHVAVGDVSNLAHLKVEDEGFLDFIRMAAEDTESTHEMKTRLLGSAVPDDFTQPVSITVVGVRSGQQSRDVVIRIDL